MGGSQRGSNFYLIISVLLLSDSHVGKTGVPAASHLTHILQGKLHFLHVACGTDSTSTRSAPTALPAQQCRPAVARGESSASSSTTRTPSPARWILPLEAEFSLPLVTGCVWVFIALWEISGFFGKPLPDAVGTVAQDSWALCPAWGGHVVL